MKCCSQVLLVTFGKKASCKTRRFVFGCKIIPDYKIFLDSAREGVFPIISYTGSPLPPPPSPKGVPFSGFRYDTEGILRVEIYERVGKSVISVFKKDQRAKQRHFMAVKKSARKCSCLRQCIYSS